jgi:hypothetical protein
MTKQCGIRLRCYKGFGGKLWGPLGTWWEYIGNMKKSKIFSPKKAKRPLKKINPQKCR